VAAAGAQYGLPHTASGTAQLQTCAGPGRGAQPPTPLAPSTAQVLSEAWAAWREFVPAKRSRRDLAFRAAHHWEGGRLARGFWGWHAGAAARRAKRAALEGALLHWRARALGAALRAWRGAAGARAARRLQGVGAEAWGRARMLGALLAAWRATIGARNAKEQRVDGARTWAVARRRAGVLRAWLRHAAVARAARRLSDGARRRLMALALEAWAAGAAARRRRREVLHGAARRAQAGLVHKAWSAWRGAMALRGKALAGALAVRERGERAVLWRALSALRLHTVGARMERMAVARWSSAAAARCFQAWRAQAAYDTHLRARTLELLQRCSRRLAWAALAGWRETAWTGPRLRQVEAFWAQRRRQGAAAVPWWFRAVRMGFKLNCWPLSCIIDSSSPNIHPCPHPYPPPTQRSAACVAAPLPRRPPARSAAGDDRRPLGRRIGRRCVWRVARGRPGARGAACGGGARCGAVAQPAAGGGVWRLAGHCVRHSGGPCMGPRHRAPGLRRTWSLQWVCASKRRTPHPLPSPSATPSWRARRRRWRCAGATCTCQQLSLPGSTSWRSGSATGREGWAAAARQPRARSSNDCSTAQRAQLPSHISP
jgi:hypothetical protein